MSLRVSASARPGVGAAIKLARLLEAPEAALEREWAALERDPAFRRLRDGGALVAAPCAARFAARAFGGLGLRTATEGLGDLLDGQERLLALARRVGAERFEEVFLRDGAATDAERARASGLSEADAAAVRRLVDRLYVREELETRAPAPAAAYSAVAGVELEGGRPALAYFHRELWSARYRVDEARLAALGAGASPAERRRLAAVLRRVELIDRRKSTLARVLEELIAAQAAYLASGELDRRVPLTQREVCARLDVAPSVLNRLAANKSVRAPWGVELPLKCLMPSAKTLLRGKLEALAAALPHFSDRQLAEELRRREGARLSRRSIAQYRAESGVSARRARLLAAA